MVEVFSSSFYVEKTRKRADDINDDANDDAHHERPPSTYHSNNPRRRSKILSFIRYHGRFNGTRTREIASPIGTHVERCVDARALFRGMGGGGETDITGHG